MKVTGPTATTSSSGARPARAAGGFSVPGTQPAPAPSATTAASASGGVAGVSALMALQGVEDPMEKRRRAIRRGGGLLDRLDELKMALLSGESGEAALDRLGRLIREERPAEGLEQADPGLNGLLDQIDLRAAVELAKAEVRRNAA